MRLHRYLEYGNVKNPEEVKGRCLPEEISFDDGASGHRNFVVLGGHHLMFVIIYTSTQLVGPV